MNVGKLLLVVCLCASSAFAGQTFKNLQDDPGWSGYALLPPMFGICTGCTPSGTRAQWSWTRRVKSPSQDGLSVRSSYDGGSTQWGDILWNNHLIGMMSSHGLKDVNKTLVPSLHDFTYDVYFWVGNIEKSQAVEFDINQFVNGKSFIWGHECRIAGGHEWDTWNNGGKHWVKSGIPCHPISNAWNHLTLHVKRTTDGHLLFNTITLNGKIHTLNRYDTPTKSSWNGLTVNYQIDSNRYSVPYAVYLDKVTFTAN